MMTHVYVQVQHWLQALEVLQAARIFAAVEITHDLAYLGIGIG